VGKVVIVTGYVFLQSNEVNVAKGMDHVAARCGKQHP